MVAKLPTPPDGLVWYLHPGAFNLTHLRLVRHHHWVFTKTYVSRIISSDDVDDIDIVGQRMIQRYKDDLREHEVYDRMIPIVQEANRKAVSND